ncbi:hypothetical protein I4U23_004831 [Adineta vaga]|nr:hypothetical protein I4U23_004831 [Adineta vaga]
MSELIRSNETLNDVSNQCRICGVLARFSYYGVRSCQPCKMFFRRNAMDKKKKLSCDFDNQCEITISTRHICGACRLRKCFEYGMAIDKFRAPIAYKNKKISRDNLPVKQFPTKNLLETDQSLLDSNQWMLLSNLVHAYEESEIFSISQHLFDAHTLHEFSSPMCQLIEDDFIILNYEATGRYLRLNNDLSKLSFNDRSVVYHDAAHKLCCIGSGFAIHSYHLLDLNTFSNSMAIRYGQCAVDLQRQAMNFIDPDIILVKLGFSLFTFTENFYNYFSNDSIGATHPIEIFQLQSKYADVTWKYLLYKYGYYQSVRRFLNLISWLMASTVFVFHAQTNIEHVNEIDLLVEKLELKLFLDEVDQLFEMN